MTEGELKKNILVLTDFSATAYKAFEYAQFLFRGQPVHFHIQHMYTPSMVQSRFMATSIATDKAEDIALTAAKKGLKDHLSRVKSTNFSESHSFSSGYSFNLLTTAVKEITASQSYDLIVMGATGKSAFESVFIGSQTMKLIKSSVEIPILAVPEKATFEPTHSIAFATDFTKFFTASELAPLISLAKDLSANIQIVQVKEDHEPPSQAQQFNIRMLHAYLSELPFEAHRVSGIHNIARSLEEFIEAHGIHMLAFLQYEHSFIEDLSKESVVNRLMRITSSPLFILPETRMTKSVAQPKGEAICQQADASENHL